MGDHRAAATTGTAQTDGWPAARARPRGLDGHHLRAQERHSLGDVAPGDGLWQWRDLLAGSPDFAAIWARQDVRGREGLKRFQHPEFGRFDLEFASFQVAEQPTLRLSLYTPADDGRSETTLRAVITARPGLTSGA